MIAKLENDRRFSYLRWKEQRVYKLKNGLARASNKRKMLSGGDIVAGNVWERGTRFPWIRRSDKEPFNFHSYSNKTFLERTSLRFRCDGHYTQCYGW